MTSTYSLPYDRISRGGQRYTNSRPRLRTVPFNGLDVSVEIDVGEIKSGIDDNGQRWSKTFTVPYGEIPSSKTLADGEGVDIYIADEYNFNAPVFIVHQLKHTGEFDEDKVVLGATSADEAEQIYRDHGPEWGFGGMDVMSWPEFQNGYLASNRKI